MTPAILAAATATAADLAAFQDLPGFRKATTPMILAYAAIARALARLPAAPALVDWGLVVGVNHGELEVTKEFLCALSARGIARPILFQSSLHNATLGFLSLQLGIQGPGATTSTRYFSGEDALSLGCDLLRAGDCQTCLCVGVEAIDDGMAPAVQALYGRAATPGSGAGVVILTAPQASASIAGDALTLREIRCVRGARPLAPPTSLTGFYGADAVSHLAAACTASPAGATLVLPKPDGSYSRLELARRSSADTR